MHNIIKKIARKHNLDLSQVGTHLRLEMPPYMPLVIKVVAPNQVSVSHVFEQNGDVMYDPEIVFYTARPNWFPIKITQHPLGINQRVAAISDNNLEILDALEQKNIIEFAELWAENIRGQGWFDYGYRVIPVWELNTNMLVVSGNKTYLVKDVTLHNAILVADDEIALVSLTSTETFKVV